MYKRKENERMKTRTKRNKLFHVCSIPWPKKYKHSKLLTSLFSPKLGPCSGDSGGKKTFWAYYLLVIISYIALAVAAKNTIQFLRTPDLAGSYHWKMESCWRGFICVSTKMKHCTSPKSKIL